MKTQMTCLVLLAALLQTSAHAEVVKNYRKQFGFSQAQLDETEKATQTRIANIRLALGYRTLKFVEPAAPYQNAKRGTTSSIFLKSLLSKVSDGFRSFESFGKPMTLDPSLFGYEIKKAVDQRDQNVCMSVIGKEKYGKNKEIFINQLYSQIRERQSLREANLNSEVANGYNSELSRRLTDYINKNGQGEILNRLGQIYQIEAIDGIVTRIRFTKKTTDLSWMNNQTMPYGWQSKPQPKFPYVIQSDIDTTTVSLEMLATMVSNYDRYFMMGTECLARFINDEAQKQEKEYTDLVTSKMYKYTCQGCALKQPMASRLAKLQAIQRYVNEKAEGARHAHEVVGGMNKKQLYFLTDLMLQLRRDDVPSGKDILPLGQFAYNKQKNLPTTADPLDTTVDHIYYSNLEEELFRVEEYVREKVRTDKVNNQIIKEIKGG